MYKETFRNGNVRELCDVVAAARVASLKRSCNVLIVYLPLGFGGAAKRTELVFTLYVCLCFIPIIMNYVREKPTTHYEEYCSRFVCSVNVDMVS